MERKEQLSHEDRVLLFGRAKVDSADRAVATQQQLRDSSFAAHASVGKSPTFSSEKANIVNPFSASAQIPYVDDLSMEARYIVFPKLMGDSNLIYDHVVNFTRNTTPNCEAFPFQNKVLGYVFHEVRFGFYCLQMFKHADGLGLSCQLQDGFAPALTPFWNAVKESLAKSGLIEHETEGEVIEEEFDDFFCSDTEDGESFSLDLSILENKFLDLRSDPSLVEEWIEDIQDPNFSQDTLLVLAYNLQDRENLEYVMEQFPQQLFEAVITSMSDAIDLALPGIRSACMFLDAVAQHTAVKVSEENLQQMICQIARWSLPRSNTCAVTHSKEIADTLSRNLLKFYEYGTESLSVQKDLVDTIRQGSVFGTVKQNLTKFQSAIFQRRE